MAKPYQTVPALTAAHHAFERKDSSLTVFPQSPRVDEAEDGQLSGHHARRNSISQTSSQQSAVKRVNANKKDMSKATSFWPGKKQIRRVFRMFDADGSGSISYEEYKAGLVKLGFDVTNEAAIMKMLHEVDSDRSGQIGEDEFVRLFRMLNRDSLQAKLKEDVKEEPCVVTIVDFGSILMADKVDPTKMTEIGCFSKHVVDASDFAKTIDDMNTRHNKWRKLIRWVDVLGNSASAVNTVANILDLAPSAVAQATLDQNSRAYFEEISADKGEVQEDHEGVLQMVMHYCGLHNNPIREDSDPAHPKPVAYQHYMGHPPIVSVTQVSVLYRQRLRKAEDVEKTRGVGNVSSTENLIVTVRRPVGKLQKEIMKDGDKFWDDVLDELEEQVTQDLFFNAKRVLLSLTTSILEINWVVKDQIALWAEYMRQRLEDGRNMDSWLSTQLNDARKAVDTVCRVAHFQDKMFQELLDFTPLPGRGLKHSVLFLATDEALGNRFYGAREVDRSALTPADHLFNELGAEFMRFATSCVAATEEVKTLTERMEQKRAQEMNNTLYMLTLVTVLTVPLTLGTGLYGMNFDNMPELRDANGYYYWWAGAGAWIFIVLMVVLVKKGVFRRCFNIA